MHFRSIAAAFLLSTAAFSPALAADLGGAPAGTVADETDQPGRLRWTGPYAGVHGGYAWGSVEQRQTTGGMPYGPFSYDARGFLGGGTLGYNWRAGRIVYGVEGDVGYMDLSGAGIIPSSVPTAHQDITLRGGLYGDITGRLGLAFNGGWLLYAKGGAAFLDGEGRQKTTNPGFVTHGTGGFHGWVAGAGLEHFIGPNLSVKAEWLHFDFGRQGGDQTSITDPPVGYVYRNTTDVTAETFKIGLNVHF